MSKIREFESALKRFHLVNFGKVSLKKDDEGRYAIYSIYPPNRLRYPKGWQYKDGFFCRNPLGDENEEAIMLQFSGRCWGDVI